MNEQDKQLLLVDLCTRLPYGVKVLIPECRQDIATLIGADDKWFTVKYDESTIYCPFSINIKPYLRSMSSMTDEERVEYLNACGNEMENAIASPRYSGIDWLNAHHFDYRGLIEKGLALEAPDGMYGKEEQ